MNHFRNKHLETTENFVANICTRYWAHKCYIFQVHSREKKRMKRC